MFDFAKNNKNLATGKEITFIVNKEQKSKCVLAFDSLKYVKKISKDLQKARIEKMERLLSRW